jgi:hypothetical protein
VEEDWEVGDEIDDISNIIDTSEGTLEEEDEVEYSPDPDAPDKYGISGRKVMLGSGSRMLNLCGEYLHAMNYYSRDLAWESR